ncbi:hypothetical protein [Gilvimarinus agarilyticus]|uniref:hypothetical protein n=1 Tax=Gilvimarinus agarilyticus TaxID=679259 RepID=UPI0012F9FF49|nr:hypothetical protein [Gilvimarinus agarilyticus]
MFRVSIGLILAAMSFLLSITAQADSYIKDNGVIRVEVNGYHPITGDYYPTISRLHIGSSEVMPASNAGGDFQITARSSNGNLWNPTLGGDCAQNPSILTGVLPNWTGANLPALPAANGILLGVTPRLYNEPGLTGCLGEGEIAPIRFNFGLTLGDGAGLPKQAMILDMSVKREAGAEVLRKHLSEFPVAFPYADVMRYAYYSTDGASFQEFNVNGSNDTLTWFPGSGHKKDGQVVALCKTHRSDLDGTTCLAFYSHTPTTMTISHRHTANFPGGLNLINLLANLESQRASSGDKITDYNWHHRKALVAVGRIEHIKAVIQEAENKINNWGGL